MRGAMPPFPRIYCWFGVQLNARNFMYNFNFISCERFWVPTAVTMKNAVFSVEMPRGSC
jgi:hypothetical protein